VKWSGILRALGLAALLAAGVTTPPGKVDESDAQAPERPNIVFILTDDLDTESVSAMPELESKLIDVGTTFNNAFVTDPLCCPSRATFLRGQYSHNTRIAGNSPPEGGFGKFKRLGLERSTVATWLDDAGYDTFYAGKYMNGYDDTTHVPDGWDRWYGWLGQYYSPGGEYRLNENGDIKRYSLDKVHDTDLLKDKAIDFIRDQRGNGKPFFAYLAPNAPHTPAYVPARHEGMFSDRSLPRSPSFNEEDMSDKPEIVRNLPMDHDEVKSLGNLYRKRLASLQSVDGMIGALITTLRHTNQLDNTYIIFASDNGYYFGEHRRIDKSLAYEESIRIPLVIRGPDVPAQKVNHLVLNNDFAPTVAQLAGVDPPGFVDGKSFVPLLRTEKPSLEAWRTGFLVEHVTPTYQALRTNDHTYVEWSNGVKELYDLEADPYQLHNLLNSDLKNPPPEPATTGLAAQLAALRDCRVDQCRAAEVQ
jgi:N-acetylglucosamine-6-sulfatase